MIVGLGLGFRKRPVVVCLRRPSFHSEIKLSVHRAKSVSRLG